MGNNGLRKWKTGKVKRVVPAAKPWRATLAPCEDGIMRPQIIDANGALLAEVRLGFGVAFARKLAKFIVEAGRKWPD
jgi:hypothetical protein